MPDIDHDDGNAFVRRGEWTIMQQLHAERHQHVLTKLDAMERGMVLKDEAQISREETFRKVLDALREDMHSFKLTLSLVGVLTFVSVAANAPGLISFITKGGH